MKYKKLFIKRGIKRTEILRSKETSLRCDCVFYDIILLHLFNHNHNFPLVFKQQGLEIEPLESSYALCSSIDMYIS